MPIKTLLDLQCAMAALYAVQDAQDGRDMQGSTLYIVGSKPWRAYYEAYRLNSSKQIMPLAELLALLSAPVDMVEAQAEVDVSGVRYAAGLNWDFEE